MSARLVPNFGYDGRSDMYCEVSIRGKIAPVEIYERAPRLTTKKVEIDREIWDYSGIFPDVAGHFNGRLRRQGMPLGKWGAVTKLDRLLGKELILLAWAIEGANERDALSAFGAWWGFSPEERWWLFTTANATCDKPMFGPDHGWRKALRIAFVEAGRRV